MFAGIIAFPTDAGLPPGELAREVEARGFESLWFAEHSHIPVEHSPWPGGDELPREYYEVYDPLVSLGAAAEATSSLRLGTGIALLVQRDPIQFAKEIATLDAISGGRVNVGVGGGWNLEEMRSHGGDPTTRFRLLRERVEAIKAIWTDERAEYHGTLVDFDPLETWPKPVQKPYPPIHIGGAAPGVFKRVIRYGDGWLPLAGRDDTDFVAAARELRALAEAEGRDPAGIEVSVCYAPPDLGELTRLRDSVVIDRVVLRIPAQDPGAQQAALDAHAELVAQCPASRFSAHP